MVDSFSTIIPIAILFALTLLNFMLIKRVRQLEAKVAVLWEYGENIKKIHAGFDNLCEEMKRLAEIQLITVNSCATLYETLHDIQQKKRIDDNNRAYNAVAHKMGEL